MVGTPCRPVHFSSLTARNTSPGLNVSEAYTAVAPCVKTARFPNTRPKQWKRGGGIQILSEGVRDMLSPMNKPLLMMLLSLVREGKKGDGKEGKHTGVLALRLWGSLLCRM